MRRNSAIALGVCATLLAAGAIGALLWQEQWRVEQRAVALTGGHPSNGARRMAVLGCGGCHDIPGVTGAHGLTGPALSGIASRVYLAGRLPNTPDNLMRWIHAPRSVDPETAMPDVGASAADARDIAAYLYTLD